MRRKWRATIVTSLMLMAFYMPSASADPAPAPAPSPTPPATAEQTPVYTDLAPDHWAYSAAVQLKAEGVISPAADGRFRPTDPIMRSELVKMILTARRIDAGSQCEGLFADAPCWAWYAPSVETAYRMAIVEGKGEKQFAPDAPVTRQELFTIVVRATGHRYDAQKIGWQEVTARLKRFSDAAEIDSWARSSVAWAVGEELVSGTADGRFNPKGITTRAEAAALINRVLVPADSATFIDLEGRRVAFAKAMDMTASMYATGEPGVGTMTYTDIRVRVGTVAVDPTVIPLGRLLYVEGYGYAVAADIGSAIKGNRIDLYTFDYHEAAVKFGLQPRRVWLLP